MARPLRVEFPGAIYHVFQRGIEKRKIFRSHEDRLKFLEYVAGACRKYDCVIHAYSLMRNHFHMILQTLKANLSRVMHYMNTSYVTYHNIKWDRVGPLYQGRYRSILVQEGVYLRHLSRYIHLNPVRAGVVEDASEYPYSSCRYFVSGEMPPEWLDDALTLAEFGQKRSIAKENYRRFLVDKNVNSKTFIEENTREGIVIGDEAYCDLIKEQYIGDEDDKEVPLLRKVRKRPESTHIIETVNSLVNDNRLRRKVTVYLLKKYTEKSLKEISKMFGDMGYTAVSQACSRLEAAKRKDACLAEVVEKLERRLKEEERAGSGLHISHFCEM